MGKYIKISFGGSDFIAYGKLDAKMNHTSLLWQAWENEKYKALHKSANRSY